MVIATPFIWNLKLEVTLQYNIVSINRKMTGESRKEYYGVKKKDLDLWLKFEKDVSFGEQIGQKMAENFYRRNFIFPVMKFITKKHEIISHAQFCVGSTSSAM